jgi:hypothetical protein
MGRLVVCRHLPCYLHPHLFLGQGWVHQTNHWWEPATPFLVGILILLVSIPTTRAVAEKAEARITKGWTPAMLKAADAKPKQSPHSHVLALAWIIDVAQIPALLGTPLAGLFIFDRRIVLLPYTTVLAAGLIVFMVFYLMKDIDSYERFCREYKGYRISVVTSGALLLNLVCAVIAVRK